MNIKEIKELEKNKYTKIEVYKRKSNNGMLYGENIVEVENFSDIDAVEMYKIMDAEDYNNNILANCSVTFDDIFLKNDKILVIILK